MRRGLIQAYCKAGALLKHGRLQVCFTSQCRLLSQTSNQHLSSQSSQSQSENKQKTVEILGKNYIADSWTNVTPRALTKVGKNLHNKQYHPINLVRRRIQNFFYKTFTNRAGNPSFAVFDDLSPVVTAHQNFDSLLVSQDHPARQKTDTYYANSNYLLRTQTTSHDEDMIRMGFDSFLVIGDVYRRDEIDATHYPVFHQLDGVRLFDERKVSRHFEHNIYIFPYCTHFFSPSGLRDPNISAN